MSSTDLRVLEKPMKETMTETIFIFHILLQYVLVIIATAYYHQHKHIVAHY